MTSSRAPEPADKARRAARPGTIPIPHDGENYTVLPGDLTVPMLFTCEHSSNLLPPEYGNLGLPRAVLDSHWGWDIGIWALLLRVAHKLRTTIVGTQYSRILIDANRKIRDTTLIPTRLGKTPVPGNTGLSSAEVESRTARYFDSYHNAVDRVLAAYHRQHGARMLLFSMHSFTPDWPGQDRAFDGGVLFDQQPELAQVIAEELTRAGLRIRLNEPYSGLRGEIESAARHGRGHGVPYFEIEINQGLLGTDRDRRPIADLLAAALPQAWERIAETLKPS